VNPVTLITGTSRGIGKFLVEHFSSKGHHVIGCSRSKVNWDAVNYEHFELDVGDESAAVSFFREIRKKYGRLDHLINNAAVASMNHALLTPAAKVSSIFSTNVIGTFVMTRESAKIMKSANFGRVVNFSSVALPLRLEGESAYAASKAAVVSLTEVLAREFAPFGITINAIGPNPIETDLTRAIPKTKMNELIQKLAIKRMGKFEDVTNIVDFFLRPESGAITGQTLYLGGL
jgi:3-oxoacyl-[acyl-carrier protein] reductase